MIAVALGLLGLVVMIATGVAASSTGGDHLTFLGLAVQTTTAQVFLTGAIFGWVFVIALWLLRIGIHRSGRRCAQLAARRGRRARQWLGFGDGGEANDDDGWDDWDEWNRRARQGRLSAGQGPTKSGNVSFRPTAPIKIRRILPDGVVGRAGATRHRRTAPWRPDGGADQANRAVAGAAEQPGALGGGHPPGPVARHLPGLGSGSAIGDDSGIGIGVDRSAQRRQIRGGPGPVPGEDRDTDGEQRAGERCQ